MKILLSPAKLMRSLPQKTCTIPVNLAQAQYLHKILSKWSLKDFEQKMKLSALKAKETKHIVQQWSVQVNDTTSTPAIFAYIGEAFKALDVVSLNEKALHYLNQNAFVLSGLYGILSATDGIAPYRLEMAQKIELPKKHASLYAFWRPKIELFLKELLEPDEVILNLASSEYSDLIQDTGLKSKMITPVFKELKAGKLQSISVFSKQARGTMARWCANQGIEDVAQIKNFNELGYSFEASLSDSGNYYFVRTAVQ